MGWRMPAPLNRGLLSISKLSINNLVPPGDCEEDQSPALMDGCLSSDGNGRTNCRSVVNRAQGLPGSAARLLPVIVLTGAALPGRVASPVVSQQDRQPHAGWTVKQQSKGEETQESPMCIWTEAPVLGRHHNSCTIVAG